MGESTGEATRWSVVLRCRCIPERIPPEDRQRAVLLFAALADSPGIGRVSFGGDGIVTAARVAATSPDAAAARARALVQEAVHEVGLADDAVSIEVEQVTSSSQPAGAAAPEPAPRAATGRRRWFRRRRR